jgi:hypothetical protein
MTSELSWPTGVWATQVTPLRCGAVSAAFFFVTENVQNPTGWPAFAGHDKFGFGEV